ncbi:MAG TPA: ribosome small subunit-dependent GTPase A [Virgibacillus sp.]|nr:ribosome small subunit-dependent GTPase A [Virgibacillus sp.]HLR69001.1 ribosome small subunit-dependent GTPase A [Virgibacillus sp.]
MKLNYMNMKNLGLTENFIQESKKYTGLFIGRVSSQSKNLYKVITENGELIAEISGKYHYNVKETSEYPAVGDFVMIDRTNSAEGNGIIHHVLSRKSIFAREMAGTKEDIQIVATNIDTVFICMSLNEDYNLRRLERYLSIAWASRAVPVIVLTKSDLCNDIERMINEVSALAIGVEVVVTTNTSDTENPSLKKFLSSGKTAAFIGSSGVGKSTLINGLLNQNLLETNEIRNDDKGRHTTTRRELIMLPNLGVVIDTPGMRELGIISADLKKSFSDIDELAFDCQFNDCTHQHEPNCAVQKAVKDGVLPVERLESYWKLKKETKYQGLNSKMIEKEKINEMLSDMGGMKNFRDFRKSIKQRKK